MATRIISVVACFGALLVLHACEGKFMGGCFAGSGQTSVEIRTLPAFSKLEVNDVLNVELVQDSLNRVEIVAGEKELQHISTQVMADGTLKLSNANKCRMFSDYSFPLIKVHYKQLDTLHVKGQNRIVTADTMHFDALAITVYSELADLDLTLDGRRFYFRTDVAATSGLMRFSGKTYYSYYAIKGYLHIDATRFVNQQIYVATESTGNVNISAFEKLWCEFHSIGNVVCPKYPESVDIVEDKGYGGKLVITQKND